MRTDSFLVLIVATVIEALGACTPYDPTLASAPFLCGTGDPMCPDGYTCQQSGSGTGVCSLPGAVGTCAMPFTGVLATWSFTGEPGSQASTAALSSAPGITAGSVQRATPLMAASGIDSINASNWPTSGQLDPASYFTFAITGPTGCTLSVASFAIDAKSSSTGPSSASVATSADAFVMTADVSITAPSTPALVVDHASGMLEIRIFGFSAAATSGTMRVENELSITGAIK